MLHVALKKRTQSIEAVNLDFRDWPGLKPAFIMQTRVLPCSGCCFIVCAGFPSSSSSSSFVLFVCLLASSSSSSSLTLMQN